MTTNAPDMPTHVPVHRIRRSAEIADLAAALAKAQGQIETVSKDRDVTVKSDKGSYGYSYATFAAVVEACRAALSAAGIAWHQAPIRIEGALLLITTLIHSSGQWIETETPIFMVGNGSAQAFGSALTYARRYGLMTAVGIATGDDEDDDAAAADQKEQTYQRRPQPQQSRPAQQPREAPREQPRAAPARSPGDLMALGIQYGKQIGLADNVRRVFEQLESDLAELPQDAIAACWGTARDTLVERLQRTTTRVELQAFTSLIRALPEPWQEQAVSAYKAHGQSLTKEATA